MVKKSLSSTVKVGFLCPHNPFDRTSFSGTAYFAAEALSAVEGLDLHILGPHRPLTLSRRIHNYFSPNRSSDDTIEKFDAKGMDVVVGLVASRLLDNLTPDVPFLHVTDATPIFLRDVYGWAIPVEQDEVEKRVARRAQAVVYSSYYMADRASLDLSSDIRTIVAPFGVNFEKLPRERPEKTPLNPLKLLFVCSDWKRKGGDDVLSILEQLEASNIPARLIVAGKMPKHLSDRPNVNFVGFLNKNTREGEEKLLCLYEEAHVLLLPSRGDCTPMVVAEAMAHGTPVIASDTGGMATLITPGTGTIMATPFNNQDWLSAIQAVTSSSQTYEAISAAAFAHATHTLNWKNWAEIVAGLCKERRLNKGASAEPRLHS